MMHYHVRMKDIRRLVSLLILLLVRSPRPLPARRLRASVPDAGSAPTLEAFSPPVIRPTAESAAIARAPQSFQYLVSLTDRDFEPPTLTVHAGETVRFTNNSSSELQLSGDGPFSGASSIAPRDFREFAFGQKGEWNYSDAATGKTGTITVQ